jgi:hypothetical protein
LHNLLAGVAENENDAAARYFTDQALFYKFTSVEAAASVGNAKD